MLVVLVGSDRLFVNQTDYKTDRTVSAQVT